MRMINFSPGATAGDMAINLDQVIYARYRGGVLDLYFGGSVVHHLPIEGQAAREVWNEMISPR